MQTLFEADKSIKSRSVIDRIKTFEDACNELGINKLQLEIIGLESGDIDSVSAYIQLIIIVRALNEGWIPDWSDEDETKYMPWFEHKSGFGLSSHVYDGWGTYSLVGSRLCFKSAKLAEYAGKQFADIYNNFLSIK